jgi:pyruvate dehydrogenase E2 component (dihydrolipoamide acetyltransferase)
MTYQFILPDIGEGVVEAEVLKWLVQPGQDVAEDQPLAEVMTDKATVTLRSPRRGKVIRLYWQEGDLAKVNQPMLELQLASVAGTAIGKSKVGTPDALLPARSQLTSAAHGQAQDEQDAQPAEARSSSQSSKPLAAPAVRALARQRGIDLAGVQGSGPGGRVTKADLGPVERAGGPARALESGVGQTPSPEPAERPEPAVGHEGPVEVIPLRGLRRTIAEKMATSTRNAAHFTFVEQADATELVRLKERMAEVAKKQGIRLTYLPFIVKAVVAALKQHPMLNATLDEERAEIQVRRWYNIGIASKTPGGLMVPVVRNADRRSLIEVAREIERLSEATKTGKARPDELQGSTFTITSLGAAGGLFATPIINHPEVAILGIHRIRPTPVVRDGQVVARDVMHISISFDHRVVDGDVAAAFAYTLVAYIEDPTLLFMEMI